MNRVKETLRGLVQPLLAVLIGLIAGAVAILIVGGNCGGYVCGDVERGLRQLLLLHQYVGSCHTNHLGGAWRSIGIPCWILQHGSRRPDDSWRA